MRVVHERCCGLDVHKRTVVACVLTPDGQQTRTFATMTRDLVALSEWLQSLGVIDGATSTWLQNVTDVRGKNPTAFGENNHVFTLVQINQAIVDGTTPDDSVCAQFGITRTGCIAVFGPDDIEP